MGELRQGQGSTAKEIALKGSSKEQSYNFSILFVKIVNIHQFETNFGAFSKESAISVRTS